MTRYHLFEDIEGSETNKNAFCDGFAGRRRYCCVKKSFLVAKFVLGLVIFAGFLLGAYELYSSLNIAEEIDVMATVHEMNGLLRSPAIPLEHAHSHNDEEQAYPLRLALGNGFCSIEADTILSNGVLHTGHTFPSANTLEKQYLQPLAVRANQSDGLINPLSRRLNSCLQHILLIDMKTDPFKTWDVLEKLLKKWNNRAGIDIFQCYNSSGRGISMNQHTSLAKDAPPVKVVISGVPISVLRDFAKHMVNSSLRCSTLDGRFIEGTSEIVSSSAITQVLSMISAKWNQEFLRNLNERVKIVHDAGALIRFWDTPESPGLWEALINSKVDLIATDRIAGLSAFLLGKAEAF